MNTQEMVESVLQQERALEIGNPRTPEMRVMTNLRNACEVFSVKCYENIRLVHEKEKKSRGLSATLEEFGPNVETLRIKIMTWSGMGRIMVTIKNQFEDSITLVGGEDKGDSIAGLHAIDCDPDVALDMLEILTRSWYHIYDRKGKHKFVADSLTIV